MNASAHVGGATNLNPQCQYREATRRNRRAAEYFFRGYWFGFSNVV